MTRDVRVPEEISGTVFPVYALDGSTDPKERTDTERLQWYLFDTQPDHIGAYDIWERIEQDDTYDEDKADAFYLRHCWAAIDQAMDAETAGKVIDLMVELKKALGSTDVMNPGGVADAK